ncbi:hypothetical protein [Bradyrhizobium sp. CB82]
MAKNVEGVELDLVIVLAAVQRVEIGDAVDAEHHGLMLLPEVQRVPLAEA